MTQSGAIKTRGLCRRPSRDSQRASNHDDHQVLIVPVGSFRHVMWVGQLVVRVGNIRGVTRGI